MYGMFMGVVVWFMFRLSVFCGGSVFICKFSCFCKVVWVDFSLCIWGCMFSVLVSVVRV